VYSAVIPCLIGGGLNAYSLWNEHWEHWEHMPPLEERTEYPYQNIRVKNYPWGDGDQVSSSFPRCSILQESPANSFLQTLL
jgi:cytochrome c oxidase subunit 6a